MEKSDFISAKEAANLLMISVGTIYQKVWRRELPAYKPFGRLLYFKRSELLALMETNRRSTTSEIQAKAATSATRRGK